MSVISDIVTAIRTAVYGREVRNAIANGIEQCYSDISTAKTIADDSVEQLANIGTTVQDAIDDINEARDLAKDDVEDKGDTEVGRVAGEGEDAVLDIRRERDNAVSLLDDAYSRNLQAINTATSNANEAAEAANYAAYHAQDVVIVSNTEPSPENNKLWIKNNAETEYTLPTWDEFEGVQQAFNDQSDMMNLKRVAVASSSGGWRLTGNGPCVAADGYTLYKYEVTAGEVYLVKSNDCYQWQSSSNVPAGSNPNVIGSPRSGECNQLVLAPEGATYMILSVSNSLSGQVGFMTPTGFIARSLTSGSDLDDLRTQGYYFTDAGVAYPNNPLASKGLIIVNQSPVTNSVYCSQIAVDLVNGDMFNRVFSGSPGSWGDWTYCGFGPHTLASGTDLNTLTAHGYWFTDYGVTYPNNPMSAPGLIITCKSPNKSSGYRIQLAIESQTGNVYLRVRSGATPAWGSWISNIDGRMYAEFKDRRTASDGGFYSNIKYQDSPKAFIEAAKAGVVLQSVDYRHTSDGVPVAVHDSVVTDINGTSVTIASTTWSDLQTHDFGDSNYSFKILSLAQAAELLKNLSCEIALDCKGNSGSGVQNNATYFKENGINPVWNSMPSNEVAAVYLENGGDEWPFVVQPANDGSNLADKLTFLAYIKENYPDIPQLYLSVYRGIDPAGYLSTCITNGYKIIAYSFDSASDLQYVKPYHDVVISYRINVGKEMYNRTLGQYQI